MLMNPFASIRKTALVTLVMLFLSAGFINASDGNRLAPEGMFIATTGRIVAIDLKNKTFTVRGSDDHAIREFAQATPHVPSAVITFPGGVSIHLPGRTGKSPFKTGAITPNLDQYTVVITEKTLLQDGADPIQLEDFTVGETISIHGVLAGDKLTASRISKWS